MIHNGTKHKNPGSTVTTFYNKDDPFEGFPYRIKEAHREPVF